MCIYGLFTKVGIDLATKGIAHFLKVEAFLIIFSEYELKKLEISDKR